MFSAQEIYDGLDQAVGKVAVLKGACDALAAATEVKVSEVWFDGAAKVLGEIKTKLEDAFEFVSHQLKDDEPKQQSEVRTRCTETPA